MQTQTYTTRGQKTRPSRRHGPCAEALELLDQGAEPLEAGRAVLGEDVATRIVEGARRLRLRRIGGAKAREREGGRVSYEPRSVVVEFDRHHIRSSSHPVVRVVMRLALIVGGWLDARRNVTTGRERVSVGALARQLNRSVREVQRYLSALRALKVLRAWQPPRNSGAPASTDGWCYELYAFAMGVPAQLRATLDRWRARFSGKPRAVAERVPAEAETSHQQPAARHAVAPPDPGDGCPPELLHSWRRRPAH